MMCTAFAVIRLGKGFKKLISMKIKGKISILIDRHSTTIEIHDDEANTTFCLIELTPDQLSAALSRLSRVECDLDVRGFGRVGKTHENKDFEFEIPKPDMTDEELGRYSQEILDSNGEGWISDKYFGSQSSFFYKDGKKFARTTIRRWI